MDDRDKVFNLTDMYAAFNAGCLSSNKRYELSKKGIAYGVILLVLVKGVQRHSFIVTKCDKKFNGDNLERFLHEQYHLSERKIAYIS
ncbi:hypothetical protein [Photobacterium angustum]|uniref:hypothetical protein n=1 Tax=Photobacterium angustum TaxID=661 RepID=UPI00138E2FAE|nr:hypothetical protein [Photobacterium angustum]